jgi:glutaconate CoA-transferase subunit A
MERGLPPMLRPKLTSMRDAIARFVPDGASVCMGTALEALIPFAAGHELIRQQKRDLTLIGPISDMLFDQLVGAGAVGRIVAAWVGNVSAGLGHAYRRAVERGEPRAITVEDHSNLTIAMGLLAGALGTPYIPVRSLLGSSLIESNPVLRVANDPFSGDPVVLVPAIVPDVAIVHVQRADAVGHAHCWGPLGVTREAARAARAVIVVAEEIAATERLLSDPNLILTPSVKVSAVVHEPWGAHPSPVQGHYNRDHDFYGRYHDETRTAAAFDTWVEQWVRGVPDRAAFLERLGGDTQKRLAARARRPAEPADFGH